jgi:uncharacterized membrane protein (UPF0127 family)
MLKYKNKIIASKIVYCDNLVRQGTGLMFRSKNSVKNCAWIFRFKRPRHVTITMFFVFFPIDIIFLDANKKIIELKKDFKPFRNYTSKTKMVSFIELESGVIEKYSLKKGMIVKF